MPAGERCGFSDARTHVAGAENNDARAADDRLDQEIVGEERFVGIRIEKLCGRFQLFVAAGPQHQLARSIAPVHCRDHHATLATSDQRVGFVVGAREDWIGEQRLDENLGRAAAGESVVAGEFVVQ